MSKNVCERVKELYCEILKAECLVKAIIAALDFCTDTSNLMQDIGIFARRMPKFRILSDQRATYILYVRQVCTGEISIEKALELFHTVLKQLDEALEYIDF